MPLNVEFKLGPKPQISLEELRELVEATADWHPNTRVNISHYDNQRDGSASTIVVNQSQMIRK